jgi:hypothetical protein
MSILNVNNLVSTSGSLEVGSVVAAGCTVGQKMTVSGNYNANGLVTLANGAVFTSPVSCSVAPTASQHLANKSYTDALLNNSSGKLVYFKAFTGSEITAWDYPTVPTTVWGNITNLLDGNYKLYAEGIYVGTAASVNVPDGTDVYRSSVYNGNLKATISYTFAGYRDVKEMKAGYYSSGGGCGGSIGTLKNNGAIGIISPPISITNNDITNFSVTVVRSDLTPTTTNFVLSSIKVYIFSA